MKISDLVVAGTIVFILAGCGGGVSTSGNVANSQPSSTRYLSSAISVPDSTQSAPEQTQVISISGLGQPLFPAIASDGPGNSIAVWVQYEGGKRNLYANRYTPEGGWGGTENIYAGTNIVDGGNTLFDSAPWYPGVVFDRNGNAMVYWTQHDWTPNSVVEHAYVRRFTPQTGWEAPQQLDTGDLGGSVSQIAFDRHGNAIAILGGPTSGAYATKRVYTRRYSPAEGWEAEQSMGPQLGNATGDMRIAFAPDDTAIAIWYNNGGDLFGSWINASRYIPGSGWSRAVSIGPSQGDVPQIGFDGNSNATAVWRVRNDGSSTDKIYAARFTSAGALEVPQIVGEAPASTSDLINPIGQPGLAVSANGDVIVAWGAGQNVFANRYTSGAGWGSAASIGSGVLSDAPRIVIDASGTALVVWKTSGYPSNIISAVRYSPTDGLGPVHSIGADTSVYIGTPEIAMDRTGNVTAIWRQGASDIYAGRFNIF